MSVIVWDELQDRTYESGLDRGVLYPSNGPAVPWNGLTSIVEKFDEEKQAVYFDGMKINDLIGLGDFEATMKAVTYPDAFKKLEGRSEVSPGMLFGNQAPKSFGLTYRTKIGNSIDGDDSGYNIHILYNVTAIPADRNYETRAGTPNIIEFEWDISAVPQEVSGYRPTAHIIINSNDFPPELLTLLEDLIYGTTSTDPELISLVDLTMLLLSFINVLVIDNGDGTWTAFSSQPIGSNPITFPAAGEFEIDPVDATYLDADTYEFTNIF